jgi:hypothetical protein
MVAAQRWENLVVSRLRAAHAHPAIAIIKGKKFRFVIVFACPLAEYADC